MYGFVRPCADSFSHRAFPFPVPFLSLQLRSYSICFEGARVSPLELDSRGQVTYAFVSPVLTVDEIAEVRGPSLSLLS
jgi:hypothetical protein